MPKQTAQSVACVEMTGPDTRMDQYGKSDEPANPWPVKCKHCTFPDLDHVAKPYLLAKGVSAPAEHSPAEVGNFLVRPLTRKVLELVVPGELTFHPTADRKTKKPTPWSLAVPKRYVELPGMNFVGPRCSKCGEPKAGYHYADSYWTVIKKFKWPPGDIFKSVNWWGRTVEDREAEVNAYRAKNNMPQLPWSHWGVEPPAHSQRWSRYQISRHRIFSIRLEQLFKKAKLRGQLTRYLAFDWVKPSTEDLAWVAEKLALLVKHGLIDASLAPAAKSAGKSAKPAPKKAAKPSPATRRWFDQHLKRTKAKKKPALSDFSAIEKKHKLKLPQDYKDFIATLGPQSFDDVNETEGFTANVLPPAKLNFRDYRRARIPDLLGGEPDEETAEIDGVMFATTDHGDSFIFDVSTGGDEYPIYWHDHEQNTLEPWSATFADCIKRFAQRK